MSKVPQLYINRTCRSYYHTQVANRPPLPVPDLPNTLAGIFHRFHRFHRLSSAAEVAFGHHVSNFRSSKPINLPSRSFPTTLPKLHRSPSFFLFFVRICILLQRSNWMIARLRATPQSKPFRFPFVPRATIREPQTPFVFALRRVVRVPSLNQATWVRPLLAIITYLPTYLPTSYLPIEVATCTKAYNTQGPQASRKENTYLLPIYLGILGSPLGSEAVGRRRHNRKDDDGIHPSSTWHWHTKYVPLRPSPPQLRSQSRSAWFLEAVL